MQAGGYWFSRFRPHGVPGSKGNCTEDWILKGSWDLVTRVIIRVTILIAPIKVLITLLTKSHDPPSRVL